MKLLMVDSSTTAVSAAIVDEDRIWNASFVNGNIKHGVNLLPVIDHMFRDTNLSIKDIDVFGCVSGPGSFTGLRIGMATVKGFAQALNKPMVTLSTLECLAANLPYVKGTICPIIDARRHQVYSAAYINTAEKEISCILPEAVYNIDLLAKKLSEIGRTVYLLGDAAAMYTDEIKIQTTGINIISVDLERRLNEPASSAMLALRKAQRGEIIDCFNASLTYMRLSSAEENLKK